MLKTVDRIHVRHKMVQICPMMCMGQDLFAAYRSLKDEETGLAFCMTLRWGSDYDEMELNIQKDEEFMHLWFEDVDKNTEREAQLRDREQVVLPQEVLDSPVYKRVYAQLQRNLIKKLKENDYSVDDQMKVSYCED